MKHAISTALVVGVIATLGILLYRDSLAHIAWEKYRQADLALALISEDAKLADEIGRHYFGRGAYDLKKAKAAYQKALEADPSMLWGHYQLANIHFVEGNFEGALSEIQRELDEHPSNLRSLYIRGLTYAYREQPGDLERATDDFTRFTKWAPSEWAGYNDLAWVLLKQDRWEEAADAAERGIEQAAGGKQNPWLWNSLGVAQLNLGAYRLAEDAFRRAKTLADELTLKEWAKAYPGNAPSAHEDGLRQFRRAIAENMKRAQAH